MKKTLVVLFAIMFTAVGLTACNMTQNDTQDFAVETLAMAIGYELRNGFDWNASVDNYYNAIMEGKMSIDAAKAAEGYLRERTHPLIANRLVKLAGMVGFKMDDLGGIVGVDNVNIHLLQVAAQGFKQGLLLDRPVSENIATQNELYGSIDEAIKIAAKKTNDHFGIPNDKSQLRSWMQKNGFLLTDEEVKRITPNIKIGY